MNDPEKQAWEQRWHPFREEWILFTSHRAGRPWVGEVVDRHKEEPPVYDPGCALCPGNARVKGRNPQYEGVYWFTNDLPTFSGDAGEPSPGDDLYRTRAVRGTAEVVCYHPDHNRTFSLLSAEQAADVVGVWQERTRVLGARADVDHVLIFENRGEAVGTSNPHPHCQIYAGNLVYGLTERHVQSGRRYFEKTGGGSLVEEIARREAAGPRVICQNPHFLACVPWFARYAYEMNILPRRQMASLADLTEEEVRSLGAILREVSIRYDNLWEMPMPFVMAIHQCPFDGGDYAESFPFHIVFNPPLRKPDTLKYLAGPEVGGGTMTNESHPDLKAAELQAVSGVHYSLR